MESFIEQVIVDFRERELPNFTPRSTVLPAMSGKVDAVIGMRRSGKTTFLYQRMKSLLSTGVPKEAMLHVNFDDDRLLPMDASSLTKITDTYYRLYPSMKDRTAYLFFDEIQNIEGWENYVRRLVDTEKVQIALTGSSSKLLSREIPTTMRGRSISTEIFPFSFAEFLLHDGLEIDPTSKPGAKQRALLQHRFRVYLTQGGFPEVQAIEAMLRLRILQEYVDVVIFRDIVERHSISSIQPLRALVRAVLSRPSGLFSVNKFFNDLKSQGIACSKNALYEYLEHLCDAYLVQAISMHSESERIKRVKPKKIYAIDTGLSTAFIPRRQADTGHLLENLVFLHLRRQGLEIAYYRTREGYEVDFLATTIDGHQALFQVCASVQDEQTKVRETRALISAMTELGLGKAVIVTMDHQETWTDEEKEIQFIPAWSFLLYSDQLTFH